MTGFPPHPAPPPEEVPPLAHALQEAQLRSLYRHMLRSRRLEERVVELYRQGVITGGCYTGIGNEATSVGAAAALQEGDVVLPSHRDMGLHLVRGHTPMEVMRQYLKRDGCQTGGKDSSLHMGVEGADIIGHISPLAHNLPVATGVAFAERAQGKSSVVLATLGDGATSLGDFHEALNFAGVQKLPLVVMIENNQYAYSTPNTIQYACERLADRAIGYGISGERVDGTDVTAVHAAVSHAAERARRGDGATLIEAMTMRMRGHSEHDDFKYVPASLLERWRAWDPLRRVEPLLVAPTADLETAIAQEIDEAVAAAQALPPPEPETGGTDVYRLWLDGWNVPEGR